MQDLPFPFAADDAQPPLLIQQVDLAVSGDRRAVVVACSGDPLGQQRLAALSIEAGQDAAVLDGKQGLVEEQWRGTKRDVSSVLPGDVSPGGIT